MTVGRLVYVMGPSGAGKDSLLRYARGTLDGDHAVIFAHRYITRPAGEDIENYIALSPGEFALRKTRGVLAFDWAAYGMRYGIGIEVRSWLEAGLVVVVDGSRKHFIANAHLLGAALPVLISVDVGVLRDRLTARGREDAQAIEARLDRAAALVPAHPALVTIDNSGPLARAGEALAALLVAEAGRTPALHQGGTPPS